MSPGFPSQSLKGVIVIRLYYSYLLQIFIMQGRDAECEQSRKRLIIIAAAPGEPLPLFPEPTYVCAAPHFSGPHFPWVTMSGWTVDPSGGEMPAGVPRRCITHWDVISDLPETAVQIQGGSADGPAAVPYATRRLYCEEGQPSETGQN